jgi:hypothetical protein
VSTLAATALSICDVRLARAAELLLDPAPALASDSKRLRFSMRKKPYLYEEFHDFTAPAVAIAPHPFSIAALELAC